MSDLTAFRDHCRKMATAEHKPECKALVETRWQTRTFYPNPDCGGCNPAADRTLFNRLAGEVDEYLERPVDVDLFGELSEMPTPVEEGTP